MLFSFSLFVAFNLESTLRFLSRLTLTLGFSFKFGSLVGPLLFSDLPLTELLVELFDASLYLLGLNILLRVQYIVAVETCHASGINIGLQNVIDARATLFSEVLEHLPRGLLVQPLHLLPVDFLGDTQLDFLDLQLDTLRVVRPQIFEGVLGLLE